VLTFAACARDRDPAPPHGVGLLSVRRTFSDR
jgi:hypothetical protein